MGESAMSSSRPVRVGLVGIGSHAIRSVIPAFGRSKMARLVAVHTRDAGVLEGVAEQTGSTPYQDFDSLLGADDVDAVYIAVPTGLHNGFARATIQAEKHVWCEKPLSTSLEDADGLVLSAAQSGVVVLESDMFLHHPQFRELKTLLDSGEFGPIRSLSARFGFPHRDE